MNYYDILGVEKNSDLSVIKKAYRELAKKYHPDLNQNSEHSTKKFQEISEAYNILSNETTRKQYDLKYDTFKKNNTYSNKNSYSYQSTKNTYKQNYYNDETYHIIGEAKISLSLKEAFSGKYASSFFKLQQNVVDSRRCNHCYGTGVVPNHFFGNKRCPYCKGLGVVLSNRNIVNKIKFNSHIPAGVIDGSELYVKYNENYIKLKITIKKHNNYKLINNDLYMTKKIANEKLILGTTSQITNIDGKTIKLTIPPNTKSGQIFRIKGRGFNHNNERGNLFITVTNRN